MSTDRVAWTSVLGLIALKLVWHVLALPPASGWQAGLATALWPLLPLFAALAFRLRGPLIYAGISVWLCFCHGAMEAYLGLQPRVWAFAEILIALVFFAALRQRSKGYRRKSAN